VALEVWHSFIFRTRCGSRGYLFDSFGRQPTKRTNQQASLSRVRQFLVKSQQAVVGYSTVGLGH